MASYNFKKEINVDRSATGLITFWGQEIGTLGLCLLIMSKFRTYSINYTRQLWYFIAALKGKNKTIDIKPLHAYELKNN